MKCLLRCARVKRAIEESLGKSWFSWGTKVEVKAGVWGVRVVRLTIVNLGWVRGLGTAKDVLEQARHDEEWGIGRTGERTGEETGDVAEEGREEEGSERALG